MINTQYCERHQQPYETVSRNGTWVSECPKCRAEGRLDVVLSDHTSVLPETEWTQSNRTNGKAPGRATVCVSIECPRYADCGNSAINNKGIHYAERYATFGGGTATPTETKTYYACGPNGEYGLYKKKEEGRK